MDHLGDEQEEDGGLVLAPCRVDLESRKRAAIWIEQKKEALHQLDGPALLVELTNMENDWGMRWSRQGIEVEGLFDRVLKNFHLKGEGVRHRMRACEGEVWTLPDHLDICKGEVGALYECMHNKKMTEDAQVQEKLINLMEVVHYAIKTTLSVYRIVHIQNK